MPDAPAHKNPQRFQCHVAPAQKPRASSAVALAKLPHDFIGGEPFAFSLREFVLSTIPPAPKGEPEIEVAFDIDANGIVSVSARDLATQGEQSITVSARGTLTDEEIEQIMREHSEFELPAEK